MDEVIPFHKPKKGKKWIWWTKIFLKSNQIPYLLEWRYIIASQQKAQ
jgi:hypothetical protein